jgi:glycosyltransferase 2 family protein
MTLRELVQRYGKPVGIALVCIFALVMVRKSLPDLAKLHPTNYGMLALGTVLFMATYLVQAFGWHLLLRALGQPVSIVDSARMFFMSMIARWMPGRVLYAATRLYIGRQIGISVTAVAFAIVLELIYILLGGVIVIVAFAGGIFQGVFSSPKGILELIVLVGIIIVAGMLAIKPSTLISLSRIPLFRRVMKKMAGEDLSEENQPRMSTSSSLLLILYAAGYWLFCGLMFGVLSSGFMPMSPERWLACIPAFAGSWLIGFFSILTPAGIGVREYAMTVMLSHSMGQAHALLMSVRGTASGRPLLPAPPRRHEQDAVWEKGRGAVDTRVVDERRSTPGGHRRHHENVGQPWPSGSADHHHPIERRTSR